MVSSQYISQLSTYIFSFLLEAVLSFLLVYTVELEITPKFSGLKQLLYCLWFCGSGIQAVLGAESLFLSYLVLIEVVLLGLKVQDDFSRIWSLDSPPSVSSFFM
jgi:hypothetical protein